MTRLRLSLALMLVLASLASAVADEITLNFRGSKGHDGAYKYDGPDAKSFITPDEKGLHWRFGDGKFAKKAVGISWSQRIVGDFAATASYEIATGRTDRGNGPGIEIYLTLDTPEPRDGIVFARTIPTDQGHSILLHHMTNDETGRRYAKDPVRVPVAAAKIGRLRLARVGKTLIAASADGDGEFKEIHRRELGDMDVRKIRVAGLPGEGNPELDLWLAEYRLTQKGVADAIPAPPNVAVAPAPDKAPAPEQAGGSRTYLWFAIIAAGLILFVCLAAGGLMFVMRLRKRDE